ncbi:MAG: DNA polymerase II [Proteobacteria bacterium]|nr:DNA polymerase II [Pseudomonadota bacterium]
MHREFEAFVLTRHWRDTADGLVLTYWLVSDDGPVRVRIVGEPAVMFARRGTASRCDRSRQVDLATLYGEPVDALYFDSQGSLADERERLRARDVELFESDIKPTDRYLMERFITGGCLVVGDARPRPGFLAMDTPSLSASGYEPRLTAMSMDIETDGKTGPILSIAAVCRDEERVFMMGDGPADGRIQYAATESALLRAFFAHVAAEDPDVLIGWNLIEFDLRYIDDRCQFLGLHFALGRGGERATVLRPRPQRTTATERTMARLPGRMAIDGMRLLRAATYSFERYSLEYVAQALLGRGKRIAGPDSAHIGPHALPGREESRIEEIRRLHREDKLALAEYNLEDCRLVRDIFERKQLLSFAIERQRMTGLSLDRVGGSVAAFDHLYLPRLHRKGFVACDIGAHRDASAGSPGGYVLQSQPGLYDDVLVLDFKSLYPSIIRTFKIDPMGLARPGADPIEGFDGAVFCRHEHILPELIASLWHDRECARRAGDEPLSRAIKILMNSFYGVLGTPGCRFFNPLLASSITRRGHEIITRSRDWIAGRGYAVIYGDTDSLFVLVTADAASATVRSKAAMQVGSQLAAELTEWWRERIAREHRSESYLEMEFETHYQRFFMPTLRGSSRGSAKRYAGLVAGRDGEPVVIIKGLEAVRTDWTPLARSFQRELFRRVFVGEPVAAYVRDIRQRLLAGELDRQLVYHKRLRRDIGDYVRNLPPHVRAARMLGRPVRAVSYLWTTRGPQPVERCSAPLDYEHYIKRQLAPAAEGILQCLDTSFDAIAGGQLALF